MKVRSADVRCEDVVKMHYLSFFFRRTLRPTLRRSREKVSHPKTRKKLENLARIQHQLVPGIPPISCAKSRITESNHLSVGQVCG